MNFNERGEVLPLDLFLRPLASTYVPDKSRVATFRLGFHDWDFGLTFLAKASLRDGSFSFERNMLPQNSFQ